MSENNEGQQMPEDGQGRTRVARSASSQPLIGTGTVSGA